METFTKDGIENVLESIEKSIQLANDKLAKTLDKKEIDFFTHFKEREIMNRNYYQSLLDRA